MGSGVEAVDLDAGAKPLRGGAELCRSLQVESLAKVRFPFFACIAAGVRREDVAERLLAADVAGERADDDGDAAGVCDADDVGQVFAEVLPGGDIVFAP